MIKRFLLVMSLVMSLLMNADAWNTTYREIESRICAPTFADQEFNITKFGAKTTNSAAKNQKAINKAIEKCNKKGGGKVIVPAGTYVTGAIRMLSNVNLVVEEGATLFFAFVPELYPQVLTRWEGLDCWNLSPCIYAYQAENIAISGKGVIDGNKVTGQARDINFKNYYVNGKLCLDHMPYKTFSEWLTRSEMKRVPQSYLLDFSSRPKWSYVMGIELEAMLDTYLKHGGDDIKAYLKLYTDTMIAPDGTIRGYKLEDYNLDNVRPGHFVTRMYQNFPEDKDLAAMKTMMTQLEKQPRTKEGVYWHKAIYAYQVWLDGIFMGLPFKVLTAPMIYDSKKTQKIYDDAVDQLKKTYERTYDSKTGLNRHAWDENRDMFWSDNATGLSQHCWGRAQGWYTMALIEVLDALPEDYARRGEVMELLDKTLSNVVKWQDPATGLWYQVMDTPDGEGNYLESTASSMFAYALLKGARKGYADKKYREAGVKAYQGIIDNFIRVNPDLTISLTDCCSVAGLGPGISDAVLKAAPNVKENRKRDGSYAYYLSEPVRENDAKGVGPFIWASLEMEQLGHGTEMLK